jgi:hypothetical protein
MTISTTPPDRKMLAAAYHEAGHAAVAVALGKRLMGVKITIGHPDHEGLRRAAPTFEPDVWDLLFEADDPDLRTRIMVYLAGRSAEQIARLVHGNAGDHSDVVTAFDLASSMTADAQEAQELLDQLAAETWTLLDRPDVWAGVQRLAAELLRAPAVTGADARRILAGT